MAVSSLVVREFKVRMSFFAPILGTASANPDVHKDYIASQAPTPEKMDEEIAAIDPEEEFQKALTVFSRNEDGEPIFWNYQIEGFFKSACQAVRENPHTASSKIKNYKKKIDLHVFVKERQIPIHYDGEITINQRPLRAQTPQGERIALASSQQIPEGAWIEFSVQLLADYYNAVLEWLDYAQFNGLGQWRNSGMGRAYYELLDDDGNVIGGNKVG